jgi:hypothetical protein
MHACMGISALSFAILNDSLVVLLLHWRQQAGRRIQTTFHEPKMEILVPSDACP